MFDMYKDKYELNVLVNGKPIREYFHNNKFFIEAKNGTEYSLKLKNHSHKKIMAVISVDGIEVLKGGVANDAESGYIINAYSSINILGYRIDENNIATFKFSDGKKSYATQVEQKFDKDKLEQVERELIAPAQNNGIIGIRIWEEKEPLIIPDWKKEYYNNTKKVFYANDNYYNTTGSSGWSNVLLSGCNIQPFRNITGSYAVNLYQVSGYIGRVGASFTNNICTNGDSSLGGQITTDCSINNMEYTACASAGEYIMPKNTLESYIPNFDLGTTWGKQQEDKVIKIKFQRAESYIDLECYYLTREEMLKMGIDLDNSKKIFISGFPKAFGDREEYCKEPNNWRKQ